MSDKKVSEQDFNTTVSNLPQLSKIAVERGKTLIKSVMDQIKDPNADDPLPSSFMPAWEMFKLALRFNPKNTEAQQEYQKIEPICSQFDQGVISDEKMMNQGQEKSYPAPKHKCELDVIVIGAGASGVGVGDMLTRVFGLDPNRVLLLERGNAVGHSFLQWPAEMRFISPSFNSQGWTKCFDLNSIAYGTSPAFLLQTEHPTGKQYASYLQAIVMNSDLKVQLQTEVTNVRPIGKDRGFEVDMITLSGTGNTWDRKRKKQTMTSRYVVWAAGEFQYPRTSSVKNGVQLFPGASLCMHNSSVRSWSNLKGDDFIIIGGYESGMDAASNLANCGKRCTVVSSTACWQVVTEDPSTELAPYTADRIRKACLTDTPPRLLAPLSVYKVEKVEGNYHVHARWGATTKKEVGDALLRDAVPMEEIKGEGTHLVLKSQKPPILCTGFEGSIILGVAKDLFQWEDPVGSAESKNSSDSSEKVPACLAGCPMLTEHDESVKTPGLFLAGPAVRHKKLSFCFVYKFRQRFGIIADYIARGLGFDTTEAVQECRDHNMFLDDFQCCEDTCGAGC